MPRRPALITAALCALTALTACQGSPEAGQPNTTPTSPSTTATPTISATPTRPTAEQAAITAAKARFVTASAAVDTALNNPPVATEAKLLQAGVGGEWLVQVLGSVGFNKQRGWYQDGKARVESISVASVNITGEQPEVRLNVCLDASKISLRYLATHKPVPVGPGTTGRSKVQAKLVYAPPVGQSKKMWFLIDQQDAGTC